MTVVGFDLSTTKVGVAKLSLDGEYIESFVNGFRFNTAEERVYCWCKLNAPRGSFYDGVSQVVIEWPMGKDPSVNTWIGAMIGGVLARVPLDVPILYTRPLEWRAWLGWPRLKRADAKRQAIVWAEAKTGKVLPEDEAEAVCMCLSALAELNRQAEAA